MRKNKLNYFDEFIKMTSYIEDSINIFNNCINNYESSDLKEVNKQIHELENKSDIIVHNVMGYIITDFLPPMDRTDIGVLLHNLDEIEDEIDEIAKNFLILDIKFIDKEVAKKYSDLLIEESKQLKIIFNNLSNRKNKNKILECIIRINEIEDQADRFYEECMKNLYRNEKDAIEVLKWTTIYNCFEELFDDFERTADCISDIIVKNS